MTESPQADAGLPLPAVRTELERASTTDLAEDEAERRIRRAEARIRAVEKAR